MSIKAPDTSSLYATVPKTGASASFLDTLIIDHGPLQLLGRFFAAMDGACAERGVSLSLERIETAAQIQSANTDSWHSFPPMLDPRVAAIDEKAGYCFVGRNQSGAAVAVMAGRVYDGENLTLGDVIEDQSFIYGTAPVAPGGPRFEISARSREHVTTPFSYIGALWVHPTHRGAQLARLLPMLTRAYALAKWNIKFDVGLVNDSMALAGMASVYGYSHAEQGFRSYGLPGNEIVTGNVLWMDAGQLVEQLREFLSARLSQVDSGRVDRTADHKN
jgi:hypothetical protein